MWNKENTVSLPNSYSQKPNAIPAYFDAMLDAQPPERFSIKFLESLGFTSTNDRLFISILKELGFLNADGVPQGRYYQFLDRSQAKSILAEGIREMFSDLFAVNTKADKLPANEVKNKLRTLYAGKKTDLVIERISKTFAALCEYADFSTPATTSESGTVKSAEEKRIEEKAISTERQPTLPKIDENIPPVGGSIQLDALQYHINIILPESPNQAVYDAIFKSLRDHLGERNG